MRCEGIGLGGREERGPLPPRAAALLGGRRAGDELSPGVLVDPAAAVAGRAGRLRPRPRPRLLRGGRGGRGGPKVGLERRRLKVSFKLGGAWWSWGRPARGRRQEPASAGGGGGGQPSPPPKFEKKTVTTMTTVTTTGGLNPF